MREDGPNFALAVAEPGEFSVLKVAIDDNLDGSRVKLRIRGRLTGELGGPP